ERPLLSSLHRLGSRCHARKFSAPFFFALSPRLRMFRALMRAVLALEDGRHFIGASFGAPGTAVGEACFNTSMTGYQEVLTDPSYRGQIVAMTAPQIGNYGINGLDDESAAVHVRGFVIEELSAITSNWRATGDLNSYLAEWKIPG